MKLEECIDQVKSCVRKFADLRQGNNKSYSMEEIGHGGLFRVSLAISVIFKSSEKYEEKEKQP